MFFEKLKKLRTEHKLSQEQLASILGYSRTAISAYELGRNEPSFEDLKKIAAYFNVSTDYLLKDEDEMPLVNNDVELTAYLEELKTRPEMKMLFSITKDATKEDVMNAVKIIEALRSDNNDNGSY